MSDAVILGREPGDFRKWAAARTGVEGEPEGILAAVIDAIEFSETLPDMPAKIIRGLIEDGLREAMCSALVLHAPDPDEFFRFVEARRERGEYWHMEPRTRAQ